MKNKLLIIIKNELDDYIKNLEQLENESNFKINIVDFLELSQPDYQKKINKRQKSNIIFAVSEFFFKNNESKLLKITKKIYSPILKNILFLCTTDQFYENKEVLFGKTHVYLISDKNSDSINFILYVNQLFNEIKVNLKLSEYIHEIESQNYKLLQDQNTARRVQRAIIPPIEALSTRKELDIASSYIPAEVVSGDIYDIIRVGKNGYGFLIADVAGHGVAAALIASLVKTLFNFHSGWAVSPVEVCEYVNQEIFKITAELGYYLTAYYGIINLETGEFYFANAGHQPALLFRKNKNEIDFLNSKGSFIGIFENPKFGLGYTELNEGDKVLIFTDGVIELKNKKKEKFSIERLCDFFKKNNSLKPDIFINQLNNELDLYSNGNSDDDRTVFMFEFKTKYLEFGEE